MISKRPNAQRGKQTGQALTEFLVVALAIIPLFLLMPMIAKYQDIGHATQLASRYTAFDATINNPSTNGTKDPATLAQEVRRRFFSNIDAPIRTNDAAGNFKAHQNLFWRGPNDEALISDINIVGVNLAAAGDGGNALNAFAATGAGLFGLPQNPLYRGSVSVPLVNLPAGITSYEPFDRINLRIDRSTTVLVDGWSARDVGTTRSRVERRAPLGEALGVVAGLSDPVIRFLERDEFGGPEVDQLQLWDDYVPVDRLRPR